jgi:hypothetical protein
MRIIGHGVRRAPYSAHDLRAHGEHRPPGAVVVRPRLFQPRRLVLKVGGYDRKLTPVAAKSAIACVQIVPSTVPEAVPVFWRYYATVG